jgi:hypothetical protein
LHLWHTAEKSIARHPELDRGPYSRAVSSNKLRRPARN